MDHALHLGLIVLALAAFLVVPVGVAVPILVITGGVVVATVAAVNGVRHLPARTGNDSLTGSMASVVQWDRDFGLVRHRGELWRATGAGSLRPKDQVRIVRAEGTLLLVQPEDAGTASRPARA